MSLINFKNVLLNHPRCICRSTDITEARGEIKNNKMNYFKLLLITQLFIVIGCNDGNSKKSNENDDKPIYYESKDSLGNVIRTFYLQDGKLEGDDTYYYSNGIVKEKVPMKKGRIFGEVSMYDNNGVLVKKQSYKVDPLDTNDYITNDWLYFFPNGQIDSIRSVYLSITKQVKGDECYELNLISKEIDSSLVVVQHDKGNDTLLPLNDPRKYIYCFDKKLMIKNAKLIFNIIDIDENERTYYIRPIEKTIMRN